VDNEQNRVAMVLSPDGDPLINAADPNEAFLDDALSRLDFERRFYFRLSKLSVNERYCEHTCT
jgi:hypothetical protein